MKDEARLTLHNEEMERRVLSNLMTYMDLFQSWQEYLSEDVFYYPKHRIIYNAIKELYDNGEIPELQAVVMHLQANPVSGMPEMYEIVDISSSACTSATFSQDIGILLDLSKRRRYWNLGQRLIAVGTDLTVNIDDIDSAIDKEREANIQKQGDVYDMRSINASLTARVESNYREENKTMLATGFPSLDEKGGFQLSDLNLIGGDTSMGKSTFATNVAVNVAKSGVPSMIYTLEMTKDQLAARINAPFSGVPSYISLYKKLRTDQLRFFEQAKSTTDSLPLFIVDSLTTYEDIKASIRTNAIKRKVKLFVIDFLQTLGYLRSKNESEASFYERVCRELKNLAKELEICIVLVVQFSRPQNKESDPRPSKSMIRGSGGIEQAADTILLLYRPNYYGRQHKYRKDIPDHVTEVIIDKGRNIGGTGTFFADYKNEQFFEYQTNAVEGERKPVATQEHLPF